MVCAVMEYFESSENKENLEAVIHKNRCIPLIKEYMQDKKISFEEALVELNVDEVLREPFRKLYKESEEAVL